MPENSFNPVIIIPPTLPVSSILLAADVPPKRSIVSFAPAHLSEKGQELFTLIWSVLDEKQRNLAEIEAMCEIFTDLADRKIKVKTHKDWEQAWADMVEGASRILPISGGHTYYFLLTKLARSSMEDWEYFFDNMHEILGTRGTCIGAILRDEINSVGFTKRLMLALFKGLVPDKEHGVALEKICGLFIQQADLDCEVSEEKWKSAELQMMIEIDSHPEYAEAYKKVIAKLCKLGKEGCDDFCYQLANILGATVQAEHVAKLLLVDVDKKLTEIRTRIAAACTAARTLTQAGGSEPESAENLAQLM